MHKKDSEIFDAEFRVVPSSCLDSWKLQLPRTQDRIGYILAAAAGASVVAGIASGHMVGGLIAGLVLAGTGAALTGSHRNMGLVSIGLAALLATTGCSREPEQLSVIHKGQSESEVKESIRRATKYQDTRAGFEPKPIVVGRDLSPKKESDDDRR